MPSRLLKSPRLQQLSLLGAIVVSSLSVASAAVSTSNANAAAQYAESELRRVKLNGERLLKMHPVQGRRVAAVVSDLEGHGLRPLIDAQIFRTPAEQAVLVKKGYSKTLFSFHNAYKLDLKTGQVLPDSLAADVVDAARLWDAPKYFWLKLASSAQSHSSVTGIGWGLSTANRARLQAAIKARNWNYTGPLGWDTAHVEPKGLTIAQAKKGVRPK